ncbi:MAG: hypothetical protein JWL83_61 [Actinomycetia bacterium]|nr:hypothetical protein [Actinomycetes bacterium]
MADQTLTRVTLIVDVASTVTPDYAAQVLTDVVRRQVGVRNTPLIVKSVVASYRDITKREETGMDSGRDLAENPA